MPSSRADEEEETPDCCMACNTKRFPSSPHFLLSRHTHLYCLHCVHCAAQPAHQEGQKGAHGMLKCKRMQTWVHVICPQTHVAHPIRCCHLLQADILWTVGDGPFPAEIACFVKDGCWFSNYISDEVWSPPSSFLCLTPSPNSLHSCPHPSHANPSFSHCSAHCLPVAAWRPASVSASSWPIRRATSSTSPSRPALSRACR